MNAGFEAQQANAALQGAGGEVLQHPPADAAPAELRPHVHALELAVLGSEDLHAAAAGGPAVDARDEKRHALAQR
jgi:hypothetical protein